jgi:2-polyprenyl-6-hydroxyphenyl methylase/3-demethylubiquinone-9 3-methyltransferase
MERKVVNNAFYDALGNEWYESYNHPIALLRAENKARAPWVSLKIAEHFKTKNCSIIDVGCGGGFLSNTLAQQGHCVSGIDLSEESLSVAHERDITGTVSYQKADAYALPFPEKHFEIVCAMDLLEHVEEPARVISEASRVLKPGGLFFFHTFNRNWFSWLFALKGVEYFVPNTPPNIHVYRLFIKPSELACTLVQNGLKVSEYHGLMPAIGKPFFQLILQRKISPQFSFKIVPSLKCGYMGYAIKESFNP